MALLHEGYQPMHPPRKEVSQERMAEILARRSKRGGNQLEDARKSAEQNHGVERLTPETGREAQTPKAERRVPLLDHELWLAKRLKEHGAGIFTGDTTPEIRMARFRKAIQDNGLQCVIVGRNKDGAPETYIDCFCRLYGEPL